MRPAASGTSWIRNGLITWIRLVLRHRQLTIVTGLVTGVVCLLYAGQNLRINTDTTDMIPPDLPWRQDFIAYRERFEARDRNILIVVDANIPEHADDLATALTDGLRQSPALYRSVSLAGSGEFFERYALMYLSITELEALADRFAAAQPRLGWLQQRFDGVQFMQMIGELAERGDQSTEAQRLYREVAAALGAAANAQPYTLSWQSLLQGERVSVAGARMSAKRMYFSSAKAVSGLGYRSRPPEEAIAAAIGWFREHDYL